MCHNIVYLTLNMSARQEDSVKVKDLYTKIFLMDADKLVSNAKLESIVAAISGEQVGDEVSNKKI